MDRVGASAPARSRFSRDAASRIKKKSGFCVRTRASRLLSLVLSVALCLSLAVTAGAAGADAGQDGAVTILYTNDVHTYIDNNVGEGNENALTYSKVAGYKATLDNVLLVDAGDAVRILRYDAGLLDDVELQ